MMSASSAQSDAGSSGQARIVEALASGAATGDAVGLKRLDTHMSHVFLAPERVYKLKRNRAHPFADMRSLEARRLACEAELDVNRRLAPELYEGVAPVVSDPTGALRVGGPGIVEDWVVVMRRFADGALFDEIASAGRLTPELVRQAATAIARFHADLSTRHMSGHAADYHRIVTGLRLTEAEGAAKLGVQPASDALFAALDHQIAKHSPLIEARRIAGWVRRGHGDLHLRNICVFNGRVTPFDALEFDPSLATADVLYDVAFLLMDLKSRRLDQLANLAMNQYCDLSRQPDEALALLPLFMALRAAVRMAVAVEAGDLGQAARYRALGLELLRPTLTRLLAIGGLSGTGKSTLAAEIAADQPGPCGARVLRSDVIRKALAQVDLTTQLGAENYQPSTRAAVYRVLSERASRVLGAGSSAIADATFREASARAGIEAAADGHEFIGLWLRAEQAVRVDRVEQRLDDASDATASVARAQTEPGDLGAAWRVVNADGSIHSLVENARSALAGPRNRPSSDQAPDT